MSQIGIAGFPCSPPVRSLERIGAFTPIILSARYGTQVAGWSPLCQLLIGTPLSLLSASVTRVYFGESAKISKANAEEQLRLFRRIVMNMALVVAPIAVVASILAPWVVPFVFGRQWVGSVPFVQVLAPSFILSLCVHPHSRPWTYLRDRICTS